MLVQSDKHTTWASRERDMHRPWNRERIDARNPPKWTAPKPPWPLTQNNYINITRAGEQFRALHHLVQKERIFADTGAASLCTKITDFGGFDSSIILMLRRWNSQTPRPLGEFPEILSQRILVGVILVGRLGVCLSVWTSADDLDGQDLDVDQRPARGAIQ